MSLVEVLIYDLALRRPHTSPYFVSNYILNDTCPQCIQNSVFNGVQVNILVDAVFGNDLKDQIRQELILNVRINELVGSFNGTHVPLNDFGPAFLANKSPSEQSLHLYDFPELEIR